MSSVPPIVVLPYVLNVPFTSNLYSGLIVPIPTLPSLFIVILIFSVVLDVIEDGYVSN